MNKSGNRKMGYDGKPKKTTINHRLFKNAAQIKAYEIDAMKNAVVKNVQIRKVIKFGDIRKLNDKDKEVCMNIILDEDIQMATYVQKTQEKILEAHDQR